MAADVEKLRAQAERIRSLRKSARVSQENAAHEVGVSVRAYRLWESGTGDVSRENLKNLARYYGTSADFIEYGVFKKAAPDLMNDLEPGDAGERLRALEEAVSLLTEQVQLLRADLAIRDAEELQRSEADAQTTAAPRRQRRA